MTLISRHVIASLVTPIPLAVIFDIMARDFVRVICAISQRILAYRYIANPDAQFASRHVAYFYADFGVRYMRFKAGAFVARYSRYKVGCLASPL